MEAVDPVFQTNMLDMLKQTGRPEMVVGWYHSHPGFGCWMSGTDMNTQTAFERLNARAVGEYGHCSHGTQPFIQNIFFYRLLWSLIQCRV